MAQHGGIRKGAGRKTKDEEDKAKKLSVSALISEFGSEQEAFNEIAARAKDNDDKNSFRYFQMLIEYIYGKPKESMNLLIEETPIIDIE